MNVFKELNQKVMKEKQDFDDQMQRNVEEIERLFKRVHPIFEEMKEALSEKKDNVIIEEDRDELYMYKFLNSKVISQKPNEFDTEEVIALRVNIKEKMVDIYIVTESNGKEDATSHPVNLQSLHFWRDEDLKEYFTDAYLNFVRYVL